MSVFGMKHGDTTNRDKKRYPRKAKTAMESPSLKGLEAVPIKVPGRKLFYIYCPPKEVKERKAAAIKKYSVDVKS